jgi:hypothetical protein
MRFAEQLLFVAAFAVAGLVVLAILWSTDQPYRDLARDNGVDHLVFSASSGSRTVDLETAVAMHHQWAAYETGGTSDPPRFDPPLFTDDEYAHMADVRRVFDGAKFLVPLALFIIIIRLQRARSRSVRDMWALVRSGSLIAAGVVALIGAIATFAFDPLFLAFHELFFPQGNFLFPPTSNLIRLYPDWYWQGITLRVGASFIAIALLVAGLAHLRLRRLLT